jgi:tight adherence protein C
MFIFLISLTIALSLFFLIIGIYQLVRVYQERQSLKKRITIMAEGGVLRDEREVFGKNKFFSFLDKLGKWVSPKQPEETQQARMEFLRAGIYSPNAFIIYWGTRAFLTLALPLGFFFFRITIFKVFDPSRAISIGIILAAVGLYLPYFWLRMKISQRKNKIFEGLPDVLDLLVVCVEAGMGLDAAIFRVAEEIKLSNRAIADELRMYVLEIKAGKSRREALRSFATRTGLEEVQSLVTLLLQAEKFGISIGPALRVYSDSFRTKRFQKAEEVATKLPVKLIFPLILFILPAMFVVLVGPAAISLYRAFVHQ